VAAVVVPESEAESCETSALLQLATSVRASSDRSGLEGCIGPA